MRIRGKQFERVPQFPNGRLDNPNIARIFNIAEQFQRALTDIRYIILIETPAFIINEVLNSPLQLGIYRRLFRFDHAPKNKKIPPKCNPVQLVFAWRVLSDFQRLENFRATPWRRRKFRIAVFASRAIHHTHSSTLRAPLTRRPLLHAQKRDQTGKTNHKMKDKPPNLFPEFKMKTSSKLQANQRAHHRCRKANSDELPWHRFPTQ